MRPFNVYVHPDFSYQPYESYHGSNVHPSRRIALALVLISAGAALAGSLRYSEDLTARHRLCASTKRLSFRSVLRSERHVSLLASDVSLSVASLFGVHRTRRICQLIFIPFRHILHHIFVPCLLYLDLVFRGSPRPPVLLPSVLFVSPRFIWCHASPPSSHSLDSSRFISVKIIIIHRHHHHHHHHDAVPGTRMPNPYSGEPKCLVMTNAPDIEITDSDSDPRKVPKTVVLGKEELQGADKEHQAYWRDTIAMYVMHEGRFWPALKSNSTFKMTKLPAGYGLYVSTRPKGEQDHYLYGFKSNGSHGVAFRSPAEFALHAKWLAFGCPKGACECKYCSRTSQKVIAARLKAATKGAEMPKKPGVNVKRVNKRKVNTSASKRATKRSRVDNMFIPAKDYTVGTSYVSELHKQRLAARADDKDFSD
ncbi:hypothetical protein ACEPAF_2982 [Sanghuangporus sanghuang]